MNGYAPRDYGRGLFLRGKTAAAVTATAAAI